MQCNLVMHLMFCDFPSFCEGIDCPVNSPRQVFYMLKKRTSKLLTLTSMKPLRYNVMAMFD